MNPLDAEGLRQRARVLSAVRRWFDAHGYLEVHTPGLVPAPAMEEHLHAISAGDGWLRTSPEFALKRVVASGIGRVYEMGPCWRAREQGPWHGTEFTMLEWYRVGAELSDLMGEVRALIAAVFDAAGRAVPVEWRRVSVRTLFEEMTGIDPAHATAVDLSGVEESWDDAFLRRWVTDVEPRLAGGIFVEDWPASQAALARVRTDPVWPVARRFEVYLDGIELANAFLELTDAAEQRQRFEAANSDRIARGEPPHPVDELFIEAVGIMPRTAGIAMGVDRLVAVAYGWSGIDRGRVRR